jgi:HAD superfamily hydrolase (TIGR01509 family)
MGVIFDMNGVLVQDEPLHEAAFRDVLEPWGIAVSHSDFRELYLGRPDEEGVILASLRSGMHLPVEEVVRAKRERYWQLVRASGAPGTEESVPLVNALRAAGLRLALATASPQDEAAAWLEALGLPEAFELVLHRDNSPEPKPSPSVYATILRRWRAAPADCAVLDDHPENVAIAQMLGLRTVAVATTFAPDQFGGAKVVVRSLAELHSATA